MTSYSVFVEKVDSPIGDENLLCPSSNINSIAVEKVDSPIGDENAFDLVEGKVEFL